MNKLNKEYHGKFNFLNPCTCFWKDVYGDLKNLLLENYKLLFLILLIRLRLCYQIAKRATFLSSIFFTEFICNIFKITPLLFKIRPTEIKEFLYFLKIANAAKYFI